jgi:protein gp37
MSERTKIEWAWASWNPLTGCTKVSAGCQHCYAETMTRRLQRWGQPKYANGFELTLHPDVLERPLSWKKPHQVFVNSMSDMFHEDVPLEFIRQTLDVMRRASWHTFQIITKRSQRLLELDTQLDWPANLWIGVTVEQDRYTYRAEQLKQTHAPLKFLCLEPLLGPLPSLSLTGIDWVILGGESGTQARPMEEAWALDIRDRCVAAGIPFWFKQWGGRNPKAAGKLLQGQIWEQRPVWPR